MILKENLSAKITSPDEANRLVADWLKNLDEIEGRKEHFFAVGLNMGNRVLYLDLVHVGGMTETIIDPKCIFSVALLRGASKLIFAHNHPSGRLIASDADIKSTTRLVKGAHLLGIEVLDHLILNGDGEYNSLAGEKPNLFIL